MSKKSSKQLGHILRKYPELSGTFNIIGNQELGGSTSVVGLKKILRKHIEKTKKEKTLKKKLGVMLKYNQTCSSQKVNKSSLGDLFACPNCKSILEIPTTAVCGHTFCRRCLDSNHGKCSECETQIDFYRSTNILVQDLIDKWKQVIHNDADVSQCRDRYQTELRYCLRSRCNAIHDNYLEETKFEGLTISSWQEHKKDHKFLNNSSRRDITVTDLECIVCSQCLSVPVTTTCGHTFCRECLARVLDHGLACPLCMAPLKITEQFRQETHLLTKALKLIIPKEHYERLTNKFVPIEILEKTNEVPIFICTNAFPKVACPLFVYEPRYRLLSRRCVQSERKRFGMAAKNPNGDKFALYGTLLEVKDCVTLQDGTSILTTIGLRRFKVLSRGEQDGYDTACVQYIQDVNVPSEKLPSLEALHEIVYNKTVRWLGTLKPRLLAEIERCIGCMPLVEKGWYDMPDGPTWTWWLVAILPLSVQLRVGFIACTNLQKRLLAIEKMLDHLKIRMKTVERNTHNCSDHEEPIESCNHSHDVSIPYQIRD